MTKIKSRSETLEIFLGTTRVGFFSNTPDGKNVFLFDEEYIDLGSLRPRLTLSCRDETVLRKPMISNQALPAFFSNLLPEGDFRKYIMQHFNIKSANEFILFKAISVDCPGNIIVKSEDDSIESEVIKGSDALLNSPDKNFLRFSLAGVQLKFSILAKDKRYTLCHLKQTSNSIIKIPSSVYPFLPENEYSMMKLAASVGIHIPEVNLIPLKEIPCLAHLKQINNQFAYVIKRFDRTEDGGRIHCEDFAQILGVKPHEKYEATNYDTMARIIKEIFNNGLSQLEQFLMRIFVNILLGNTDAHLKNWAVWYRDGITPELAPAYDIISTLEYIPANVEQALNMAKIKKFYAINKKVLNAFAKRVQVEEKFVLNIADKVVEQAHHQWPILLNELPITPATREALIQHWKKLPAPFSMNSLADFLSKTTKSL